MNECVGPPSIKMPVVATGVLVLEPFAMLGEQGPGFSLEQANLCMIGPWR